LLKKKFATAYGQNWRGTMTPKNREELARALFPEPFEGQPAMDVSDYARRFDQQQAGYRTDAILRLLDAAGLAIVPKEPTPKMYEQAFASSFEWENKGWEMSPANCYRAMLEASPYRGKDEKTAR
jgi:hypothetical protein